MKSIKQLKNEKLFILREHDNFGGWGFCHLFGQRKSCMIILSFGGGWDHVSAAYEDRTLTWDEMNRIKDIFFHENEIAIQIHPKKENYINTHPYVLHLWRNYAAFRICLGG